MNRIELLKHTLAGSDHINRITELFFANIKGIGFLKQMQMLRQLGNAMMIGHDTEKLFKMTRDFSHQATQLTTFSVSDELLTANRNISLGALSDGMQGDEHSQRLYESLRITSWHALPNWIQEIVYNTIAESMSGYDQLLISEQVTAKEIRQCRFPQFSVDKVKKENFPEALLLSAFATFADSKAFVAHVEKSISNEGADSFVKKHNINQYRPPTVQPVQLENAQFNLHLSPVLDDKIGKRCRDTLTKCIDIIFKGIIIEDKLHFEGIEVSDEVKIVLFHRSGGNPWLLEESDPYIRLQNTLLFIDSYRDQLNPDEAQKLLKKSVSSPDETLLHGKKRQELLTRAILSKESRGLKPSTYFETINESIEGVLKIKGISGKQLAQLTKSFVAVWKHSPTDNYPEIIKAILDPSTSIPEALVKVQQSVSTAREAIKNLSKIENDDATYIPDDPKEPEQPATRVLTEFNGAETKFVKWYKDELSPRERSQVDKALARLRLGILGDFKRLHGDTTYSQIYEFRIANVRPMRLYAVAVQGGFLLFDGGFKSDQAQQLKKIRRSVTQYLENQETYE